MIKLLLLALSQVSVLQAAYGSCTSLKKIPGSENWHFQCGVWMQMTNCGNGCCCNDGWEYKDGSCKGVGGWKGNVHFVAKCCWNKYSVFPGDLRHGKTVRELDGCTEWTCVNGVMRRKSVAQFNSHRIDVCKKEPDCEEGFTKLKGYPLANAHKYPPERVDVTRKACADACKADDNCIAYTAKGMCMATQLSKTFADSFLLQKMSIASLVMPPSLSSNAFISINYCVKDGTIIATGANSCEWSTQIPKFTNFLSLEKCALKCAEHLQCRAIYLWKKNPFSSKPLCVGFSRQCSLGSISARSSSCRGDHWCGYDVISTKRPQKPLE